MFRESLFQPVDYDTLINNGTKTQSPPKEINKANKTHSINTNRKIKII